MDLGDPELELALKTILIVEDEEPTRNLIMRSLQPRGYRVLTAADGESGWQLLESEPIGVVLTDKNLPGMSGIDLLRRIHERGGWIKAIVMTAFASTDSAVDALRLGAIDYMQKPFDIFELTAIVENAFKALSLEIEQEALLKKHSTLFETIPGLLWFMTENGVFKRINRVGAQALGYDADQLIGKPYDILLPKSSAENEAHWAFKERRTGWRASQRVVTELQTADGEMRIFEIYSSGVYVTSSVAGRKARRFWGTIGVAHDITEQTRLQEELQQAQRMEALSRLAGGLAHHYNNILSVILTNTELVEKHLPADSQEHRDMQAVQDAARRAVDLTQQLLAFSCKKVIQLEPIELAEVIQEVADTLQEMVGDDIALEISVEDDLWPVMANAGLLEQVLLCLVANARGAMPTGGTLTMKLGNTTIDRAYADERPDATPGDYVLLAVRNSGPAISPEERQHLFEPFYDGEPTSDQRGLGLAAVYGAVKQSGGFVSVRSPEGAGTTIEVYFCRATQRKAEISTIAPAYVRAGEGVILLVEDDFTVRRAAKRVLESAGYFVREAANGAEALALAERSKERFAVLVTDMVMPGISGSELALKLRERDPMLRVVYMSGYVGSVTIKHKMLESGARFLAKPFAAESLLAAVNRVLCGDEVSS